MVLPQSLMIASLLGMLVLALQHTVTQQTASVQARLDGLRQRRVVDPQPDGLAQGSEIHRRSM